MKIIASATFFALAISASAQQSADKNSFGISFTFAPDSSHILIGRAEQRQVFTLGLEYDRTLVSRQSFKVSYEGTVNPFFRERDPTISGSVGMLPNGAVLLFPTAPIRVVAVNNAPIGYASVGSGAPIPLYETGVSTAATYAIWITPIGFRLNSTRYHRVQPTFAGDFGLVLSKTNLPVDLSSDVNYTFSFGPGIEFNPRQTASVRLEYVYRHMSNANSGLNNPGVDSGVIRLTLLRHRSANNY